MSHYIVSLDIGSATIRAAVAEVNKQEGAKLVSLISMPSEGIRRGIVDNTIDATHAVSTVLNEVKKVSRSATKNILLGFSSPDIKIQYSKGVVAVSRADDQIYEDDIARVMQSSQAINIPANRMVLHSITKEFIVDGIDNIRDPLGMVGKRLEVSTIIIDAFSPNVKNLIKAVETLGASVDGVILSPIAASTAVLSKNQRELGVVLIDIGFSKTSMAVYEEDRLIHTAVIPIGAGNITNDLAIGLRIPIEAAETIKRSLGSALSKDTSTRDVVDLSKLDPRASGTVNKKFISSIIEDRLAEIFELINNEIAKVGRACQLPAGAVLVGGGVKIPNITELAKRELRLSAQIGIPNVAAISASSGELNVQAEDPEFATVIGLLLHSLSENQEPIAPDSGIFSGFKKILNAFIP